MGSLRKFNSINSQSIKSSTSDVNANGASNEERKDLFRDCNENKEQEKRI